MNQHHNTSTRTVIILLREPTSCKGTRRVIIKGYYMAKTILNSVLHEQEHYCASVRPIALLLERSECNNAIGRTHVQ